MQNISISAKLNATLLAEIYIFKQRRCLRNCENASENATFEKVELLVAGHNKIIETFRTVINLHSTEPSDTCSACLDESLGI